MTTAANSGEHSLLRRLIWSQPWRRVRRALLIVAVLVVLYTLAGFVGIPLLIGHELRGRVARSLARPISIKHVRFNPYSLRLDLDRLAIANRAAPGQFVQIAHVRLVASWSSLTHLALVVRQLTIQRPQVAIVRGPHGFNFADLITPKAAPTPTSRSTFRFAMANIELEDGSVSFDDQVLNSRHHIEQMQLGIPFIANLPSDVEVYVQPRLAMLVDGSPFRLTGKSRLFGASRDSFVNLKWQNLDLIRFSPYLPPSIPLRLHQGSLSTDLQIDFAEHPPQMLVRVAGSIALDGLDLRTPTQVPLLALKHGAIVMTDVQPLEKIANLQKVTFDGLTANLTLLPGGATNLGALTAPSAAPAGTSSPPMRFSLDGLALPNATLQITDKAAATPVNLTLHDIHLSVSHLANTPSPAAPFDLGTSLSSGGTIAAQGTIGLAENKAAGHVTLTQIALAALSPLSQPYLSAGLADGSLDSQGDFTVAFGTSRQLRAQGFSARLSEVALRDPAHGPSPLRWKQLQVVGVALDLLAHRVSVDRVNLEQPQVSLHRQHDGKLNLAALVHLPAQAAPTSPQGPATPSPPAATWQYRIGTAAISDGQAQVEDDSGPQPLRLALSALNLQLHDLTPDLSRPVPLNLTTTVDKRGQLKASGTVAPNPLRVDLRTQVRRLPLANEVNAYLTSLLNARVSSAFADESGTVVAKLERGHLHASYRGDASLADVRLIDSKGKITFLEWSTLRARRLAVMVGVGQPRARIGELELSRFFGQLMLDSQGRLSVRNLFATAPAAPAPATHSAAQTGHQVPAHASIDKIVFDRGRINWTDHFIRPNYSAALTDLRGTVGAISTDSAAHAPVRVQGHINQSATISIDGQISPLAPMAFVDLTANADGVSLPNLSPYSVKYTGYPIEQGTLSLKVHYLLDHHKLTAQNHIVINQLTFGPQVESKSALNLPIRLAVALLKDPNGRIRVDVPISGSLSDPEFSLTQALLNAFGNLITKAATAPFSLLASAFNGGNSKELSYIQFAPGSTQLSSQAIDKLSTLAKALEQRPSLNLAIGGRADPTLDTEGARKALLDKRVRQAKIAYLLSKGRRVDRSSIEVSPSEYNRYLKMAYKAADFQKPRDFLGLEKSLPPAEMEKLLLEHTQVKPEDLLALANQRAAAVRHWLAAKVSPNRLLVTSPKLMTTGTLPPGEGTRVKLALE